MHQRTRFRWPFFAGSTAADCNTVWIVMTDRHEVHLAVIGAVDAEEVDLSLVIAGDAAAMPSRAGPPAENAWETQSPL